MARAVLACSGAGWTFETMPFLGGGDMIDRVTIEETTYADPPQRFEAGTLPIVEVIGLGAAIDFVQSIGMENIRQHEQGLLTYAHQKLAAVEGLNLIGTAPGKLGVVSTMDYAHAHDISTIVDRKGVAIRAGHHCAQPLMDYLGVSSTARQCGIYTRQEDFDCWLMPLKLSQDFCMTENDKTPAGNSASARA